MPRFENPIEYQFAAEAAAALGQAGHRLRKTLDELEKYDASVAAGSRRADPAARTRLIADAAEAYWGYVVQRELIGLQDPEYIAKEYQVPAEVLRVMGPKRR